MIEWGREKKEEKGKKWFCVAVPKVGRPPKLKGVPKREKKGKGGGSTRRKHSINGP